jgi:hypothetical protein
MVAGLASALFVHWLVGLFWVEASVAILAADRAVGLRAFVLTDMRRAHPGYPWPPSKSWIAQIAGAVVLGLAIAYLAIRMAEPLAFLAAMMVVLGGYMLWAIPALKRRQQGSQD